MSRYSSTLPTPLRITILLLLADTKNQILPVTLDSINDKNNKNFTASSMIVNSPMLSMAEEAKILPFKHPITVHESAISGLLSQIAVKYHQIIAPRSHYNG